MQGICFSSVLKFSLSPLHTKVNLTNDEIELRSKADLGLFDILVQSLAKIEDAIEKFRQQTKQSSEQEASTRTLLVDSPQPHL